MSLAKKLIGQTAVYGLSSILGRLLNYLLISLHTRVFPNPEQMGVVTDLYAYVTFLLIVFTYGMETAYFRFSNQQKDNPEVYNTSVFSILLSSSVLSGLLILFSGPIATFLQYPNHPEYVVWFALILGLDAIVAIPFARLRQANKAAKFAALKILNIFVNIAFNLYFLLLCPYLAQHQPESAFLLFYNPEIGVGYIFIANLIASIVTLLVLLPQLLQVQWRLDTRLLKQLLIYAMPLLIAGFAGMINETIDRLLLKFYLPGTTEQNLAQTGIYGSAYKLSIFMTLAIQAFRMAAEPFYFAQADKEHAQQTYATVMKHFVLVCLVIFLGVMFYMDIIRYIIHPNYWEGIKVVPVLLMANLFLGVYYNLSVWYKISGKTLYGAYMAIFGALITLMLNFIWIPVFGYMGSAWATFICYFVMAVACYVIGQKYYPVPYQWKKISAYILFAVALYGLAAYVLSPILVEHFVWKLVANTVLLLVFVGIAFFLERPGRKLVR